MFRPRAGVGAFSFSPEVVYVNVPDTTTLTGTFGPLNAEQNIAEPVRALRLLVIGVEADSTRTQYGDPMPVIRAWALDRGVRVSALFPFFTGPQLWKWCANHATDPLQQFETQILDVVSAWNDSDVAAGRPLDPVYVMGFSGSGYGALTLLARHPEVFAGAVCFDAPLAMVSRPVDGLNDPYGSAANFEDNYRLTDAARIDALADKPVVISGFAVWGTSMQDYFPLLSETTIAWQWHERTGSPNGHSWVSGWIPDALDRLLRVVE